MLREVLHHPLVEPIGQEQYFDAALVERLEVGATARCGRRLRDEIVDRVLLRLGAIEIALEAPRLVIALRACGFETQQLRQALAVAGVLDDTLRAALTGISTPSERLRLVITCYLEFARCHTAAWGLIGTSEATLHPVVQDARRSRCERMAEAWGGTPEARVLARAIVGFLEAASLEWVESGPSDVDAAVRLLHTVLWSGLENLPASDAALDRAGQPEIVVG
jgi:hypothetical protein